MTTKQTIYAAETTTETLDGAQNKHTIHDKKNVVFFQVNGYKNVSPNRGRSTGNTLLWLWLPTRALFYIRRHRYAMRPTDPRPDRHRGCPHIVIHIVAYTKNKSTLSTCELSGDSTTLSHRKMNPDQITTVLCLTFFFSHCRHHRNSTHQTGTIIRQCTHTRKSGAGAKPLFYTKISGNCLIPSLFQNSLRLSVCISVCLFGSLAFSLCFHHGGAWRPCNLSSAHPIFQNFK